jgi:hypothetical protein
MTWSTVVLGLVCCIALAQDTGQAPQTKPSFVRAAGQTYYLDLDTAEGAYSKWRHDDLGGLCALQASVRIPRLRKHVKWRPTFTIALEDSAVAGKTKLVGLQIGTVTGKPPLDIRVLQLDGSDMVTSEISNTRLGLDAAIPVEMVWLPEHSVVIKIGENETHRLKIPWQIERISITASTGQMKIDPLVLGCIDKAPH